MEFWNSWAISEIAELFQTLKDDAVKVLHSICQQIWKTQQWPKDWKRSVFISISKEGQCQRMFKLLHNWILSHTSKVMLKILQASLQQYVNHELPDVQAGFRKGGGTRRCFHKIRMYHQHLKKGIFPGIICKIFNQTDLGIYHSEWTLAVQPKPWVLQENAIR